MFIQKGTCPINIRVITGVLVHLHIRWMALNAMLTTMVFCCVLQSILPNFVNIALLTLIFIFFTRGNQTVMVFVHVYSWYVFVCFCVFHGFLNRPKCCTTSILCSALTLQLAHLKQHMYLNEKYCVLLVAFH